jgi:hypothetical protein
MSRKKPEIPKPENHERWIVTYADMLTLLFALFVVLWSMSDPNATKLKQVRTSLDRAFNVGVLSGATGASPIFDSGGGLTPSITEIKGRDLAAISKVVGNFSQRTDRQPYPDPQRPDSITISLSDNLLFDSGSATLRSGSQTVLNQVAAALRSFPRNPGRRAHRQRAREQPRLCHELGTFGSQSVDRPPLPHRIGRAARPEALHRRLCRYPSFRPTTRLTAGPSTGAPTSSSFIPTSRISQATRSPLRRRSRPMNKKVLIIVGAVLFGTVLALH